MNAGLNAPPARDFWKSSGFHLVSRNAQGWLEVTPDLLRAYYARPEIHPVEESCSAELSLFSRLMETPTAPVSAEDLAAIADPDTAENYRFLLGFRDHLLRAGSIEAGYTALFRPGGKAIPPVFLDQMVHLILRNILDGEADPMVLRAAEMFFRPQIVRIEAEQIMLADHEIVARQAQNGSAGGEADMDILTRESAEAYWARSDQFDTAVDFRLTQPASDALAQVMSRWITHFLGLETRIQAMGSIRDQAWSWHIGCDGAASQILNQLYHDGDLPEEDLYRLIGLYRLEFEGPAPVIETMAGKPIYLGCAMDAQGVFRFKPQNLLTNLPLRGA
ncbi:MAG: DUF6352 family protein [Mangrovicoccus sp.]|nr:DUF6352 family protein [Mangrovicoccus sp.]